MPSTPCLSSSDMGTARRASRAEPTSAVWVPGELPCRRSERCELPIWLCRRDRRRLGADTTHIDPPPDPAHTPLRAATPPHRTPTSVFARAPPPPPPRPPPPPPPPSPLSRGDYA